jgi:transposase
MADSASARENLHGSALRRASGSIPSIKPAPGCGGVLHAIGETVSEMLDHVPARLRVIRICRRYGCRA